MSYLHIPSARSRDRSIRRIFEHADGYLADVHTILNSDPGPNRPGRGNFSIALILACVIDGLATEIYPVIPANDAEARIVKLLECMPWGTKSDGWVNRLEAAKALWRDVRNPLTHNLAADTHPANRRLGFSDPAVVVRMRDNWRPTGNELDRISEWNNKKWPVMWAMTRDSLGKRRFVLSDPALYWHVKQLAIALSTDSECLRNALELRKQRRVVGREETQR